MTTSGTVGATIIDVATIIEHAFRRCGVSPAEQTTDAMISARQSLYFYLSTLVNDGVNLWTIEKVILGTIPNKTNYQVGTGTVDIKNVFRRTLTLPSGGTAASSAGGTADSAFDQNLSTACTQTSPNGNISYESSSTTICTSLGFLPRTTSTLLPVFEGSNDGSTWTSLGGPTSRTIYPAGIWYYYTVPLPASYSTYRVRETSGGTLDMTEVVFAVTGPEIMLGRMSLDQYSSLTNKDASGIPTQYWFDRKADNPEINIYQTSNTAFSQLTLYRTRQIQDVGTSTNTLELPQRWINTVITNLSVMLLLEQPKADKDRYGILKAEAEAATKQAQQEERDNSPFFISPNISAYTR